jgi:hypothetical protein
MCDAVFATGHRAYPQRPLRAESGVGVRQCALPNNLLSVGWAERGGKGIRVLQNGIGAKNARGELSRVADV